jgi:hypothetical protein
MEAFGRMISAALCRGLLSGFSVGNVGGLVLSHILFANDTLIFCSATPNHLRHMWCLFLCFETASGLNINLAKSELKVVVSLRRVFSELRHP